MLKRVKIQGYKSLLDVEVHLPPLTVLFGPNAAGKSNFLDALQLLSRIAASRTVKEAFEPPYRGQPIESFTLGEGGLRGLLEREHLVFSIEVDLYLSDAVIETVNRQIREMRQPSGGRTLSDQPDTTPARIRQRNLRYRVEVEMIPRSGTLRIADEYLAALNADGTPTRRRRAFIERQGEKMHLRLEGQAHPTYFDRYLDHTILSMPHYPPHYPHLVAARRELESWLFFYFEPREKMRAVNPVKEVRHIGLMGEELAAYLKTLKELEPKQFDAIQRALQAIMPNIEGIEMDVNDIGEVELRLKEGGIAVPARVLSEGTLRMLGLLALTGVAETPSLVGLEEPENGVHPRRIQLIAELLNTRAGDERTQYIVTTHSPILPDLLPNDSLFVVSRDERATAVTPFASWGPLARKRVIDDALGGGGETDLPVSKRILRGDFGA